jgi:hypothetical protein
VRSIDRGVAITWLRTAVPNRDPTEPIRSGTNGVVSCHCLMNELLKLLLPLAAAYAYSLAAWPILRSRGRVSRVVSTFCGIAILLTPLLVPAEHIGFRAIAAYCCVELMFKMLDYARQFCQQRGDGYRFADYARFLIPFPTLIVTYGQRERRLPRPVPHTRMVLAALLAGGLFAAAFIVAQSVSRIAVLRSHFPVDHVVKVLLFVVAIEALSRLFYNLERLAGFDTTPLVRHAFTARTVGEFWCRFNTRVHAWLDHNVFRPAGGRRAPARGIWATFFVSAVFHELMFGIATTRFDGYQFAFFTLQAPAVLVSRPLNRLAKAGGLGKAVAHGLTIGWLLATSTLFFQGVDRVFPFFYAGESWLP